ncbi:MAG: hypothetical protein H7X80_06210 [bacterium]|nr:hypothetical protein [Candidatus Kapabacteria bacterium]
MKTLKGCEFQKASDVDREYASFELMIDDEIILEVGFSDDGEFQVFFEYAAPGLLVTWSEFQACIERGRELAELDR